MIELRAYAYFNNKTVESILRKIYLSNIEHNVTTSKIPFLSLLPRECLSRYLLKTFFMYARTLPVQKKVHFKKLQFSAVAYLTVPLRVEKHHPGYSFRPECCLLGSINNGHRKNRK